MAKKKTFTLSEKKLDAIDRVLDAAGQLRGVDRKGQSYGRRFLSTDLWVKIVDYDETGDNTNIYNYAVDLYTNPWAGAELANGVNARNVAEKDNTSSSTDVEPVPVGTWHKVLGMVKLDGTWRFIFSPGGTLSLPTPTARYQVLSITAFTNSTDYTIGWDWVRAH